MANTTIDVKIESKSLAKLQLLEIDFHQNLKEWDRQIAIMTEVVNSSFFSWLWDKLFIHKYRDAAEASKVCRELSEKLLEEIREETRVFIRAINRGLG